MGASSKTHAIRDGRSHDSHVLHIHAVFAMQLRSESREHFDVVVP
jgi:hypothetical protein